MAGPFYRITIHNTKEVVARTDGNIKFECFVEIDAEGTDVWSALPDASNHFDVIIAASAIGTIDGNPAYDTQAKKRKALEAAIIAADARLLALRDADDAARKAINWMNLRTGAETWLI